jgi:uncharacterized protein (TIGR03067 family)
MRASALLLCPLVLVAAVGAADPSPEPDQDDDAKTILGSWQAVKGVKRGTPATAAEIEKLRLEVMKDKLSIIEGREKGPREERITYKLDPKAKPRTIDLTLTGRGKEIVIRGIYKIEKGELTIVTGEQDDARPKAFDEKGRTVLVFRKAKAKK